MKADLDIPGYLSSGWSFAQVPEEAFLSGEFQVSPRALQVFTYLIWRAGNSTVAWPGVNKIAADLSISKDTARRALRELEAKGWLVIEPQHTRTGTQLTNAYKIRNPAKHDADANLRQGGVANLQGGGSKSATQTINNRTIKQAEAVSASLRYAETANPLPPNSDGSEDQIGEPHPAASPSPPSAAPSGREQQSPPSREATRAVPRNFQEWTDALKEYRDRRGRPNVIGGLMWMHSVMFPDHDPPKAGMLGKLVRRYGWRRIAQLFWELSTRPPAGDVLAYIAGVAKHQNLTSVEEEEARRRELLELQRRTLEALGEAS